MDEREGRASIQANKVKNKERGKWKRERERRELWMRGKVKAKEIIDRAPSINLTRALLIASKSGSTFSAVSALVSMKMAPMESAYSFTSAVATCRFFFKSASAG